MGGDGQAVNVVWFRRDLRLADHAPLAQACESGLPLLSLYLVDPGVLANPHYSERHWRFVTESLADLDRQLESHGVRDESRRILQRHVRPDDNRARRGA